MFSKAISPLASFGVVSALLIGAGLIDKSLALISRADAESIEVGSVFRADRLRRHKTDLVDQANSLQAKRMYSYQDEALAADSGFGPGWIFLPTGYVRFQSVELTDAATDGVLVGQPAGHYKVIDLGARTLIFRNEGDSWKHVNVVRNPFSLSYQSLSGGQGEWQLENTSSVVIFDQNGRQLQYARNGSQYSYHYNSAGQLASIETESGAALTFSYNAQGHVAQITQSDGATVRYGYDSQGRLTEVVAPDDTPLDDSDNPITRYTYDSSVIPHMLSGEIAPNGDRVLEVSLDAATGEVLYHDAVLAAAQLRMERGARTIDERWSNGLNAIGTNNQWVSATAANGTSLSDPEQIETAIQQAKNDGRKKTYSLYTWEGGSCLDCLVRDEKHYNNAGQLLEHDQTNRDGRRTQTTYRPATDFDTMSVMLSSRETRHGQLVKLSTWSGIENDNQLQSEEEPGRLTTYQYDANGRRSSQTVTDTTKPNAASRITSYQYSGGQLTHLDGPRTDIKDITTFEYDGEGNLIKVTNGLNQSTHFEYDDNNRRTATIDPNGLRTEVTYGTGDRILSQTLAAGTDDATTTSYQYDANGNLTQITLETGQMITRQYDAQGRVTQISDTDGNRIDYQYDLNGNLIKKSVFDNQQQSLVQVAQQAFDDFGRIVTRGNGDVAYQYQGGSEAPSAIVTDSGNTQLAYDQYDRLSTSTDALGGETRYQYDEAGNITQVTDARGVTTSYEYNGFGERTAEHSPSKGTLTYKYDEAGNVIKETRENGIVIKRDFDELNRLTQVVFKQSGQEKKRLNYTYDNCDNGIGKLCKVNGAGSTTRYDYDLRGNYSQVKTKLHDQAETNTTKYEYNEHNQLTRLIYPSGLRVRYHYRENGSVRKVTAKQGDTSYTVARNIQYRPMQNGLSQITFGNGLTTELDYNQQGQLTRIATGDVQEQHYQYDANGNITQIDRPLRTDWLQQFEYDAMNRLVSESRELQELGYEYDSVGNRLVRTKQTEVEEGEVATNSRGYHYAEASNRLDKINNKELIYDPNGNLIEDRNGKRQFQYDVTNRLTHFSKNGNQVASYTYNAFGQRIKKTIQRPMTEDDDHKSLTFTYLPEGWLISEDGRDSQNQKGWTRDYIWLGGKPIAQIKSRFKANGEIKDSNIRYIHTDHLNTPRIATDANSGIIWRWDSDAFGEQKADQDPDNDGKKTKISLRFPGQYYDSESNLHYNHYRDYDPQIGRYIQSDPRGILLDFSDPQRQLAAKLGIGIVDQHRYGLNHLYGYVHQDPLAKTDPTGEAHPVVVACLASPPCLAAVAAVGLGAILAQSSARLNECIELCIDRLPTSDFGFTFWNCVNRCMASGGGSDSDPFDIGGGSGGCF